MCYIEIWKKDKSIVDCHDIDSSNKLTLEYEIHLWLLFHLEYSIGKLISKILLVILYHYKPH